jgi:hypothetical protein
MTVKNSNKHTGNVIFKNVEAATTIVNSKVARYDLISLVGGMILHFKIGLYC